jgi:hypothetical protein
MSTHSEKTVDQAISDPAKIYGTPHHVLTDGRLDHDQKKTILESWALDQRRLMESEDENMPQVTGGRPSAAALYQDILKACRKLDA